MRLVSLLSLVLALATPAWSMYQDQFGQFDWLTQYVGRVHTARYQVTERREHKLPTTAEFSHTHIRLVC